MQKTIIYIILSALINTILHLLGLPDNEIDFINYIFKFAYDYYLYYLFMHYIYPKIIKHIKRWFTTIKEYIIDVKSRLW
jgi:hypothetical protein